jgi:hypothetical protein
MPHAADDDDDAGRASTDVDESWFLVRLDLERIRRNLAREDGRPRAQADVRAFLIDAGFRDIGGGASWLVREVDLGHVQPAEVTSIEAHDGPQE